MGEGRRPRPCSLTIHGWDTKSISKLGLRNTNSCNCPADNKGSSTAFLWRRHISNVSSESGVDYSAWEEHKFYFSSTAETMTCYENDSAIYLLSMLTVSASIWEMPKLNKQNPGSTKMPRYGPDKAHDAENPMKVLRVPEWFSEMPKQLPCQAFPSRAHSIRNRGLQDWLEAFFK